MYFRYFNDIFKQVKFSQIKHFVVLVRQLNNPLKRLTIKQIAGLFSLYGKNFGKNRFFSVHFKDVSGYRFSTHEKTVLPF